MIISGLFCLAVLDPKAKMVDIVDIKTIGKKQETHLLFPVEPEAQKIMIETEEFSFLILPTNFECIINKNEDRYCVYIGNDEPPNIKQPSYEQMVQCAKAFPNIKIVKKRLQELKKR
jgi:hypothetical protein